MRTLDSSRKRLLAVLTVITTSATLSSCQTLQPGDLLGTFLSDLTATVSSTLQQLGDTVGSLNLELAGAIRLDIDQATSAYADSLDKTVDSLDSVTKQSLNQIKALVDELSSQAHDELTQAIQASELILSQIPFTNKNPRVVSYNPTFTTSAASSGGLIIALSGSFVHADEQGYSPVLKVNGNSVDGSLVSNTLTELKFRLPMNAFTGAIPDIEVDLPYDSGNVFSKKLVPGVFHLYLAKLPDSPIQSVRLSTSTPTTSQESQPVTTGEYGYSSLDCKPHGDTVSISPPADNPDWSFDTTSLGFNIYDGYPKGPAGTVTGPNWVYVSPKTITFNVSTTPVCPWPLVEGGRTYFTVSYTLTRSVAGPPNQKVCSDTSPASDGCPNLSLQWGGNFDVAVPQQPGTWQLQMTLFNGASIEAGPGSTSNQNPFITINDLGSHVQVQAVELAKIPSTTVAYFGTQG